MLHVNANKTCLCDIGSQILFFHILFRRSSSFVMDASYVYLPSKQRSTCGYCDQPGNRSYVMLCENMLVEDYQLLSNRGWRRCGTFYYKSVMNETCCPLYSIRCEALNFRSSRSQRKVVRRFNNFLKTGMAAGLKSNSTLHATTRKNFTVDQLPADVLRIDKKLLETSNNTYSLNFQSIINITSNNSTAIIIAERVLHDQLDQLPKRLKAKHRRWLSKMKGLKDKNLLRCEEDYLKYIEKRSPYTKFRADFDNLFVVEDNLKLNLQMRLFKLRSLLEDYPQVLMEEHLVYKKYQMHVHKEDESKCEFSRFKNFLVYSSLYSTNNLNDALNGLCYGGYHCVYFINNAVAAVSVLDFLPTGLSSVYFFYDPAYECLSLGTYSALRDIAFVRYINHFCSNFKYYFLGLYVHSCPKMRYKAKFFPSYLLCPEVYTWVPYDKCAPLLDKHKYHRLEADVNKTDEQDVTDVDEINIYCNPYISTFQIRDLLHSASVATPLANELKKFAQLVGRDCASNLVLQLHYDD